MFKPEDQKALVREEKIAKENIRLTGDMARACLNTSPFKRYKEQYVKAEAGVVDAMLKLTEVYVQGGFALEAYATKTLVYMTKLKDIRALLTTITSDSRRGKDDEKHEDKE